METLTEREKKILELIIDGYIYSAEPIASRTIEKLMRNRLSSATIRNTMADLEEKGFIFKPHVVAGRMPTQKAFQYYVNTMLILRHPGKKELRVIDTLHKPRYYHIEKLMEDASRVLAAISQYTSIVVEPKIDMMVFKEIEFVKLSPLTILIVFVTSSGIVHTRIVDTEENIDNNLLQSMKAYMNEKFGGRPFYVLQEGIIADLQKDKESVNRLLKRIKDTVDIFIQDQDKRDIYIEGASKMVNFPEFADIDRLRELLQALEKKEKLLRLLDHCLKNEGINVIIGIDGDMKEMRDMSVITSTYQVGEKSYGILGVIGPVRMDYSKIIPIANYTAKAVTDILNMM